jgi:Mor family transcriptional regulator
MKRKWFSTEQIIRTLKEAQLGNMVKDLCRKYAASEQNFYSILK